MENLSEYDFYQAIADLDQAGQVHISGLGLNSNLQPVVHITTPLFHRGQRAGGVTVDVLAESFLQFVSGPGARAELADQEHLVLLDSHGMYLADTRAPVPEFGAGYTGHLLGFDPQGGVTLNDQTAFLLVPIGLNESTRQ